jgi:hypothetical protein
MPLPGGTCTNERSTICLTCKQPIRAVESTVSDALGVFDLDDDGELWPHQCPPSAVVAYRLAVYCGKTRGAS